ncbi:MAG: hypothetical protein J3K34DRAFT_110958 [Monoraphidium minutum]|nr:MAG: hypothetical protein J3K34DRAFT_110958 [Monoraphidium minutum]
MLARWPAAAAARRGGWTCRPGAAVRLKKSRWYFIPRSLVCPYRWYIIPGLGCMHTVKYTSGTLYRPLWYRYHWYIYRGYTNGNRLYFTPGGGARTRARDETAARRRPSRRPPDGARSGHCIAISRPSRKGKEGQHPRGSGQGGGSRRQPFPSSFICSAAQPACAPHLSTARLPTRIFYKMSIHRCTPPRPDHTGCNRFPIDCNRSQSIAIGRERSQLCRTAATCFNIINIAFFQLQ